jgi:Tol biopolymer transport system component
MELVPGEDLAQRLARGPLPVDESLKVGARVAEALEAAHEAGVVHRDLKPSNIVLMPGGAAKVLDFGLAKSLAVSAASDEAISRSPTRAGASRTMEGVILGTAAYMSPEQARGTPLDKRTDIWSFGCVLYECLTGKPLFRGETVSDSIGAILHKDPDWNALPAATPPTVRLLLRRCLARDPEKRLRDIGDARIELEQAAQDPSVSFLGLAPAAGAFVPAPVARRSRLLVGAASALIGIVLGAAVVLLSRPSPAPPPLRKLDLGVTIEPPASGDSPARISPDGTKVVFVNRNRLWVQFLNEMEPRALEGTEGGQGPFWSPDGMDIAYFQGSKLWRIAASGGRPTAIADLGGPTAGGFGGDWGEDGHIVYSRGDTGLLSVSALGGEPKEIVARQDADGDFHEPSFLPHGQGFLFVVHPKASSPGVLCAYRDGERNVILATQEAERFWRPVYAPSGYILFRRTNGSATAGVWAIPFDPASLSATGEPFLVAPDAASPSVSRDGTLAFVNGISAQGGSGQLFWVDRTGRKIEPVGGPRDLTDFAISPDGRRLAIIMRDNESNHVDLWVRDLERSTETRLTDTEDRFEFGPTWTPDGKEIFFGQFFSGMRVGDLQTFRVPADGSGPPTQLGPGVPTAVTSDGRYLVSTKILEPDSVALTQTVRTSIWKAALDGSEEAAPILRAADDHVRLGRLSPDEKWIAYESRTSGRPEVFISRYPEGTGRWQVSTKEGVDPHWDPRGDRIYYQEGTTLMEVSVDGSGDLKLGRPAPLFDLVQRLYAAASDGQRFLVADRPEGDEDKEAAQIGIKVVAGWVGEFR